MFSWCLTYRLHSSEAIKLKFLLKISSVLVRFSDLFLQTIFCSQYLNNFSNIPLQCIQFESNSGMVNQVNCKISPGHYRVSITVLHQYWTSITPVSRHYHASIGPVSRQYHVSITSVACHQQQASSMSVSYQYHASTMPVAGQYHTSCRLISRQYHASSM